MSDRTENEKVIAFGCWSNDPQRINAGGQCGLLRGRLFSTEKLAREFYNSGTGRSECTPGDVIVRLTVEALGDV